MAYDKLVDSSQLNSDLGDVADAIRAKSGGASQLAFPVGFISEIGNISTGGGITPTGTKQISITQNGTTTEDVTNYASAEITVNVSSSGGGGGVLLADYTAQSEVSAIQIDFTSEMQGYDLYYIALSGTFNKQPYPYIGVNTATNNRYMNQLMSSNSWAGFISKIGSNYTFIVGAGTGSNTVESINYVHMRAYAADGVFKTGFNVKIWGYMNQ